MRQPINEAARVHPKTLSITIETVHELKDVNSVIRVALSALGTVKDIKVIPPETANTPPNTPARTRWAR